jgi:methylisocitrate lyase
MRGKRVIPRDDYVQKVRAAVDARGDRDFFIVARTDAAAAIDLDEAIRRVEAAREVGADASFVEAPTSLQEMTEVGRRSPAPNVANMIEGGKTPVLPQQRLAEMGFHLILYPLSGLFSAAKVMDSTYRTLKMQGTSLGSPDPLMTFSEFNDLIGVDERYALSERFDNGSQEL